MPLIFEDKGEYKYKCTWCKSKFVRQDLLERHEKRHRAKESRQANSPPQVQPILALPKSQTTIWPLLPHPLLWGDSDAAASYVSSGEVVGFSGSPGLHPTRTPNAQAIGFPAMPWLGERGVSESNHQPLSETWESLSPISSTTAVGSMNCFGDSTSSSAIVTLLLGWLTNEHLESFEPFHHRVCGEIYRHLTVRIRKTLTDGRKIALRVNPTLR